jgi:hypothetical protein
MKQKETWMHYMGLAASLLLAVSCFLPWVYINSMDTTFTGFKVSSFPNGTYYGRAGIFILPLSLICFTLTMIPKIWAKRTNLFVAGFLLAFSLRTYFIFTSSLFDGEVIKKIGIYGVLILPVLMLISAIFPKIELKS